MAIESLRRLPRSLVRWFCAAGLGLMLAAAGTVQAMATPSFATQTGEACQACHVGGFGPQLTPFGRDFKLHAYAPRLGASLPFSAMAVASYIRTQADQPPEPHFNANDNVALDEFSLFLASGLGTNAGAFVQTTYDGIARDWTWDNLDIRAARTFRLGNTEPLLGVSLNNSPSTQDPWNTLPAWGYPYTSSDLAPSPAAAPLLDGGLAQNSLGLTGYAWIASRYYLEVGAYGSPDARTIRRLGGDPDSPGDLHGLAPYGRLAFQKTYRGNRTLEVGAFGLKADIYPGRDRAAGSTDRYRDLGVDASYQQVLAGGDIITAEGRYTNERQSLDASQDLGLAQNRRNTLQDLRGSVSYHWRNRIGVSAAAFRTTGSTDALLYADARKAKPNSTGVVLELDDTFFGQRASRSAARFSLHVGAQYTFYPEFNGARGNFDSAGAAAHGADTFRIYTWAIF